MKSITPIFNVNIFFVFVCFLAGCSGQPVIHSIEDYLRWLNGAESGLVKTRYVQGIALQIKFLPSDYWRYQGHSKTKTIHEEGTKEPGGEYPQSLTFLMRIGPDERKNKGKDIMWREIFSYPEYKERMHHLNFALQNRVSLRVGNQTYRPVLARMENVYGLRSSRNIIFVFTCPAAENQHEKLDFVFEDDLFDTGIHHFVFRTEAIENTPHFTFSDNL